MKMELKAHYNYTVMKQRENVIHNIDIFESLSNCMQYITAWLVQDTRHVTQTVNCCELTQDLTQAGANENKCSFVGRPSLWVPPTGSEGNRCVEWDIVAAVTTVLDAGPTPCPST